MNMYQNWKHNHGNYYWENSRVFFFLNLSKFQVLCCNNVCWFSLSGPSSERVQSLDSLVLTIEWAFSVSHDKHNTRLIMHCWKKNLLARLHLLSICWGWADGLPKNSYMFQRNNLFYLFYIIILKKIFVSNYLFYNIFY